MTLIAALLLSQSAFAVTYKWWGFGPTLGSTILPTRYPTTFPTAARVELPAKDGGTEKVDELDKVGGDLNIGARINMYPSAYGRIAARTDMGFGTSGFFRWQFTGGYDAVLLKDSGLQVLLGGSIGVGRERFNDRNDVAGLVADDSLKVTYFPLRVDISALLRDKTRAYELGFFSQFHVIGAQDYCAAENCTPGTEGDGFLDSVAFFYWDILGINATVWFGDFKNDNANKDKDEDGDGKKGDKKSKKNKKGS